MSSHILDKLEALKSNEIKLKEERRVLEEQLELEIEKKRRMKLDGTLTKMEVQVDALAENFKGDLMPDNSILVYRFGKHNFTRKEIQEFESARNGRSKNLITLEKFKDNLSKIDEWMNEGFSIEERIHSIRSFCGPMRPTELIKIPDDIKIYSDFVPLFRTMIGIMEKQQRDIDELKR
jgi:hypothetical protein